MDHVSNSIPTHMPTSLSLQARTRHPLTTSRPTNRVEGTLVEIAASVPLLRPLFKRRFGGLKSSNKPSSYELPHYTPRAGKADSSGFGGKLGRGRTTIQSTGMHGGLDDDSSMEGILPMSLRAAKHNSNNNAILVRQEYSVNFQDVSLGVEKDEEDGMTGPAKHLSDQSLSSMDQQHLQQHSVWSGSS